MLPKEKELRIENEEEFHEFLVSQGLEDYNKVPVEKVRFSRMVKFAFWFLRIYIVLMILLVVIGFSHIV
ncbi:MAG: hypothetical protein QW203_05720 [Thermoplasmatales archaeon]